MRKKQNPAGDDGLCSGFAGGATQEGALPATPVTGTRSSAPEGAGLPTWDGPACPVEGGRGLLVVISGPSGVGKGSVRKALAAGMPDLVYAVSATTRAPRPGEVDGVHYHFLSEKEFHRRRKQGEFVEWANVYGHLYGTPGQPVYRLLREGHTVIMEKDVQGARTLRGVFPDGVFVFLLPPSAEELWRRQEWRATEKGEGLALRRKAAPAELAEMEWYDYAVVNDDLEQAVAAVRAIITAERCRVRRMLTRWRWQ